MNAVRIKICGVTSVDDALLAADLGVDAIGLNFWPRSKRFVSSLREAKKILRALPPFVTVVGVFVNATRAHITETVGAVGLHAIQLHGDERPSELRGYDVPVFKALHVPTALESVSAVSVPSVPGCPLLVVDAQQPGYGGGGVSANWAMARRIAQRHRILLAGGLTPRNVAKAIRTVRPFGVDVASGVESAPGVKSRRLLNQFVRAVRAAQE